MTSYIIKQEGLPHDRSYIEKGSTFLVEFNKATRFMEKHEAMAEVFDQLSKHRLLCEEVNRKSTRELTILTIYS